MENFVPLLVDECKQLREFFNDEFSDVIKASEFFQVTFLHDLKQDYIFVCELTNLQSTYSNKSWVAFSKIDNKNEATLSVQKIMELLTNITLDYFNEYLSNDREIFLRPDFEKKQLYGYQVALKGEVRNPKLEQAADELLQQTSIQNSVNENPNANKKS